jgi:hypothetical protein
MKRIIRHSQLSDPEGANALCTDKMCLALSSVLIYPTTHERMTGKRVACVQMCACVAHAVEVFLFAQQKHIHN